MILFIIKSIEVIVIKTYYIEKMDKHKIIGRKIQFENDNIKIYIDLEKENYINICEDCAKRIVTLLDPDCCILDLKDINDNGNMQEVIKNILHGNPENTECSF